MPTRQVYTESQKRFIHFFRSPDHLSFSGALTAHAFNAFFSLAVSRTTLNQSWGRFRHLPIPPPTASEAATWIQAIAGFRVRNPSDKERDYSNEERLFLDFYGRELGMGEERVAECFEGWFGVGVGAAGVRRYAVRGLEGDGSGGLGGYAWAVGEGGLKRRGSVCSTAVSESGSSGCEDEDESEI